MFFRPTFDFIIVGLGNPGVKYAKTRHNAGFLALDLLAQKLGVKVDRSKFDALVGEARVGGLRVLLVKPQTFMNLSGRSAAAALRFYKLTAENVVVIFDDAALPLGTVRVRGDGSAGGHNGIKSLIAELGTQQFARVKIGVGENKFDDLADWVLSAFDARELEITLKAAERATDAALEICKSGAVKAAAMYNGSVL